MVASEYGWTFEDFKNITLRTLQNCLDMIDVRTHNDYAKNAALHGAKIDFKHVKRKFKELTDEQKRMMAEVTKRTIQENLLKKSEKARKRSGNNN